MEKKYIFFDIDGTLWDEQMQIPQSTERAISRLKENGHKTFLCSGRARGNIRSEKLLGLGFDGIIAACGNYIEMDGEVLCENVIPAETVKRVIGLLRECRMPVVLEGSQFHWIDEKGFEDDPFVAYLFREMGETALPLRGYSEDIRINKFSADILADTDYGRIKRELREEFDFLEHEGNVVEFVPKGTSKATGMQWLCEHFQVPIEDTYAVGDSVNDLDMLTFAGHSIAMGNATKTVKELAEFVTTDVKNDGIYAAMEHYGLL